MRDSFQWDALLGVVHAELLEHLSGNRHSRVDLTKDEYDMSTRELERTGLLMMAMMALGACLHAMGGIAFHNALHARTCRQPLSGSARWWRWC